MTIVKGLPVSAGIAIGTAFLYTPTVQNSVAGRNHKQTVNPEQEQKRLSVAIITAEHQLSKLIAQFSGPEQQQGAAILNTQKYLLKDPELTGAAKQSIADKHITAEQALAEAVKETAAVFADMDDDPYLKERASDIKDIGRRLLSILAGKNDSCIVSKLPPDSIVIAGTLDPSDTAQLDCRNTAAIITEHGGQTSHSAILARNRGLPAVAGIADLTGRVTNGDVVIVDGTEGKVIIKPDATSLGTYKKRKTEYKKTREAMKKNSPVPCRTRTGKRIILAANIGSTDDICSALENGAEAVGLFRTEFLYLNRNSSPDEDEQYNIYKAAAEKMNSRPLIIRTLDIGGDKEIPYLHLPKEGNPFLGTRAIRLCFSMPELFKTQLRALLRAAVYGNMRIMFPMIASVNDIQTAKRFLKECADELKAEREPYNADIKIGIMIEIPAAALIADDLAKNCDFFSIGTNDLVQYTLAVDRTNDSLASLYDPFHPAVLALIKKTIQAAHHADIPCGMCGEFAANPKAIPLLLEYGLDEFSVNISVLPETRQQIMHTTCSSGK